MNKRSTCLGVMPTWLNLALSASIISIRCVHNSVNCPVVICSPNIAFIVYWERDITSECHDALVHIIIISLHRCYLLCSFSFSCTFISSCVWPFVNNKAGEIDNLSVLVGSKVTCVLVCRSRQIISGTVAGEHSIPVNKLISGAIVCHLLVVSGILRET